VEEVEVSSLEDLLEWVGDGQEIILGVGYFAPSGDKPYIEVYDDFRE
jgi:hypothetical protein